MLHSVKSFYIPVNRLSRQLLRCRSSVFIGLTTLFFGGGRAWFKAEGATNLSRSLVPVVLVPVVTFNVNVIIAVFFLLQIIMQD